MTLKIGERLAVPASEVGGTLIEAGRENKYRFSMRVSAVPMAGGEPYAQPMAAYPDSICALSFHALLMRT